MPSTTISQRDSPNKFAGPTVLHAQLPGSKEMYTLSGVVITEFLGDPGGDWHRDKWTIKPSLSIPAGQMLRIEQAAPFVTINTIFDADTSVNAGFAVDAFGMSPGSRPNDKCYGDVGIDIDLAVRDRDAALVRVGYTVTIIGRYETTDLHDPDDPHP